jgi:hypothetical protein
MPRKLTDAQVSLFRDDPWAFLELGRTPLTELPTAPVRRSPGSGRRAKPSVPDLRIQFPRASSLRCRAWEYRALVHGKTPDQLVRWSDPFRKRSNELWCPSAPPTSNDQPRLWQICFYCVADGVPRRSLVVALIVGTVLNLINQGDALFGEGHLNLTKIILTFAVPYCVATYGAVSYRMSRTRIPDDVLPR